MSVKSRQHLARLQGQYVNLVNRFMARWDDAADDLLQQRYTPTRLFSDVFGFWGDVGTGVGLALELAKGDFPRVRFLVKITDKTANQAIALPKTMDGGTVLKSSPIGPVDGGGTPNIPEKSVIPSLVDLGDGLAVQLNAIDKAKLAAGDYEGQITDGNGQIVAYILLRATT